ncbi:hypothetical protein C1Y08_01505 [Pseudomonas sp. FW306-02-F02-AA]|nr:hypothetical protein C1Y07_01410 [Pseudomonas sp. FW306-02-F02-AB]PMZ11547.1 hypothetical protein C1Y06_01730 [Pseudomonas sp. FW306-02-H06C]PMZ17470.1 hypothetical protein C1Y08_01505 [Pseudomonas sp. FW306-02-F02-AA]PMZ21720.1 hypothetical protein C1Y09_11510 [Pseudomonas sp. FW306-02-F08-AA]PMZ25609.1 hypothetical protein C1Y05_22920 [Pseudomonas sp. FW306-02-F04-BA]PMZ35549.1 hypothetical protein C1X99_06505 [Pseudomonas sp. FW306-02-H06B]PMZ40899.1 hypothetical protein C1Y00_08480 [Ps
MLPLGREAAPIQTLRFFSATVAAGFTTAAQSNGSKLPRHRGMLKSDKARTPGSSPPKGFCVKCRPFVTPRGFQAPWALFRSTRTNCRNVYVDRPVKPSPITT